MTTTSEEANVTPITAAKKAPAKKAPAKASGRREAAKETAAKKKPSGPQHTRSEYPVVEGKSRYAATGRGGKINVRNFDKVMTHAVDVADPKDGRTEEARKGLIFRFFPDKERAEAFATKKNDEGYDAIVVTAKKFEG